MKKKILLLSLALFMLTASFANAAHYLTGVSSVDAGEIRWGGSTVYSTQWYAAIYTWNALNKIKVAPDDWYTYEDLTVSDVNRGDGEWYNVAGRYTHYSYMTDTIKLNQAYLNRYTVLQRQMTATHELGHAHGLNDHAISGNVMYRSVTSRTQLGTQDISDYRYLWGY